MIDSWSGPGGATALKVFEGKRSLRETFRVATSQRDGRRDRCDS